MKTIHQKTGWAITAAALGINLLLGILYSWSVLGKALVSERGWSNTEASLPYTVCVAVFALMMVFAGRAQDVFGPRRVAMLGGLLFGGGLAASAFTPHPWMMVLSFGVLGGMGIGFGYSAATPCALKWFEPGKKGLISGIVVSGVGLSPVYIAPLTHALIQRAGIEQTFLTLGLFAFPTIVLLALVLRNPSAATPAPNPEPTRQAVLPVAANDRTWREMVRTGRFYQLWAAYLMSATAGLMLLAHLARIALVQAGWQAGFLLVVILSLFNAGGRIVGGILSDKAGRIPALLIVFLIQAVNMALFPWYQNAPLLAAGSAVAGLAYGALFALFPAATADFFGVRNLGVNYGLIFTGWGVAGLIGPVLGGAAADLTGTYTASYLTAAGMLLAGVLIIRPARKRPVT